MRIFIVRIFFILAAALIFPKTVAATVVTLPGVSYASITIDYTFTLGTVTDTLQVNSISVVVGGPSSAYSTILPENSLFTGFTPLAAPSCGAGLTCLDDFGILNAGRPGGLDPFSNFWVWHGSEQSFGSDSLSGIVAGIFTLDLLVHGNSLILASAGDAVSLSLPDGSKSGLDFNVDLNASVPEPSTWAMLLIGFAAIGFATYLRRSPFARMFA